MTYTASAAIQPADIRLSVPVQALELYHPMGLTEDWADKMQGQNFYSKNQRATFEHYMQVS